MTTPLLSLTGVSMSFGPIDVLHDISLDVQRRSEEHTSETPVTATSRMPSSA